MPLCTEYLLDLKHRLTERPHGERGAIIEDAAALLGVSVQTLYRRLAELGFVAGRKIRADRGLTCVDRGTALLACGMVHTATRANGKATLPLKGACDLLEANGRGCKINSETGEVTMPSPSTVSRVALRYGCHPQQLGRGKAAIEMQSPHPNWCWQTDASVCVVFYLPGGKVQVFDEKKFYKNKMDNLIKAEPERVIRWVVTDHYSGAFFLRYTLGAEDTRGLLDSLTESMCRRDDTNNNDCLYGVPKILVADKGSSLRSGISRNLLNALGVRLIPHLPGNPRAKGQVEQAQNLIETHFEGRLRMYTAADIDQLNAAADEWRIAYNLHAIHSRHGKTRHAMWRTIREEQLLIPADRAALLELATTTPEEVRVPHNLLLAKTLKRHGRHEYDLRILPGILPKQKILLQINPFRAPCVDVTVTDADGQQHMYTLEPILRNEAGFRVDAPVIGQEYKALKDTATDKALKEIEKQAYGVDTLQEAEAARAGKQRAYADIDPFADIKALPMRQHLPKRGRDLTLAPTMREDAPLSLVDAAFVLRGKFDALGQDWTPEHFQLLKTMYPDTVPAADMPGLVKRLLDALADERRAGMQLVAGGAA